MAEATNADGDWVTVEPWVQANMGMGIEGIGFADMDHHSGDLDSNCHSLGSGGMGNH